MKPGTDWGKASFGLTNSFVLLYWRGGCWVTSYTTPMCGSIELGSRRRKGRHGEIHPPVSNAGKNHVLDQKADTNFVKLELLVDRVTDQGSIMSAK
uniref:Uncharacterized protein n=1 Tax=Tanacetum cinerariifolium TaxID=118510 RepID=A0A6L2LB74_TANCI|nr:hypothetical protein [Tanacetum cinerariifolium]